MYIVRHGRVRFVVGHPPHQLVRTVDADVPSFETLSLSWAKDRRHVFSRGEVVPGLAPSELRCSHGLIKTETDVYLGSHPLHFDAPLDVKSFRPIGGPYFRDDEAIYCVWYSWDDWTCDRLDADVASFEHLEGCFGRDNAGLFNHTRRSPNIDASTFSVFHSQFARDKSHVFSVRHGDKHSEATSLSVIEGADPATFEVFHAHYARDKSAVYFFDDCGSLASERFLLVECIRVDTERPEAFVPLLDQEADPIVPDGFDGTELFLRGRRLKVRSEDYRVRTTGTRTHLEYINLDRVSELVAAAYDKFFPTEMSPESVDPASLGPVDVDGGYRAPLGVQAERHVVVPTVRRMTMTSPSNLVPRQTIYDPEGYRIGLPCDLTSS